MRLLFGLLIAGEPFSEPAGFMMSPLPPWQSMQASCTVPVVCMLGESVSPWHDTQPALRRIAASGDWRFSIVGAPSCAGSSIQPANRHKIPAITAGNNLLETETDIGSHRVES